MPWQNLGNRVLVLNQWVEFNASSPPLPAPVEGTTFRFSALGLNDAEKFISYCLVRFRYQDGLSASYTRSFRIYPQPERIVQVVPIPPGMATGNLIWVPEAKKIAFKRFIGRATEPSWALEVEDWVPEAGQPEGAIEEQVATIANVQRFLY